MMKHYVGEVKDVVAEDFKGEWVFKNMDGLFLFDLIFPY